MSDRVRFAAESSRTGAREHDSAPRSTVLAQPPPPGHGPVIALRRSCKPIYWLELMPLNSDFGPRGFETGGCFLSPKNVVSAASQPHRGRDHETLAFFGKHRFRYLGPDEPKSKGAADIPDWKGGSLVILL